MTIGRPIRNVVSILTVALPMVLSTYSFAADRDERAAAEYVYCGRVIAVLESAAEASGRADGARAFRQIRGYLVVAATLRSDTEFMKQEIQNSAQRFKQRFPGQDVPAENRDLSAEGDRCISLWINDVKPLLGFK